MLGDERHVVGLKNFISAFCSVDFLASLKVSGTFALVNVTLEILVGTLVALLLNQPLKGIKLVRSLLVLPWAVPTVVNAIMWRLIYNPEYGALNSLLYQLRMIKTYTSWLGDTNRALLCIMFADLWKNFSLVSLIVLASLQTLSHDETEAAVIDGANTWQRFTAVTLPHIIPAIQIALVLRIIEAVKVFDIIYVMTKGGPANKTRSASIFIYQKAFTEAKLGFGAALAIIMVCLIMIFIFAYMRIILPKQYTKNTARGDK
ncbi:sugar ABC transporter permease [Treponema sp. HNW]|uniref:carbohydrate ABC transporter permease n=1 Tax=Treponema sp. HNW TaxID=3116654 RepID=UPI003D0AC98C